MSMRFEAVADTTDLLGEGPVWDSTSQLLYWLDGMEGIVRNLDPATGRTKSLTIGGEIGCLAVRSSGGLIIAAHLGIYGVDSRGHLEPLATVDEQIPGNRFNDGKCDSRGRLWAGTMSPFGAAVGSAAVYRIDPPDHRISTLIPGITVSNGIAWSADESCLYHVDTFAHRVDRFDFDPVAGSVGSRRVFATIANEAGLPDGLCVDQEGFVWLAVYGAGELYRFSPEGRLDDRIAVPEKWVTSMAFGGPDLKSVYVTTATRRIPPAELPDHPLAGRLLVADAGVAGLPFHRYGG